MAGAVRATRISASALLVAGVLLSVNHARAQAPPTPGEASLEAGRLAPGHVIDGRLDEADWASAVPIVGLTQSDPVEGAPASAPTRIRVLASATALVIGIECQQPPGTPTVSFSVRRDAPLSQEDHVKVALGPFLDGRTGYTFAVNPSGARYDAMINPAGGDENADWDGIWNAATSRTGDGWTTEIWIPFHTLSFKPDLTSWHFNIQRRIQSRLETDRWAFPARQFKIAQIARAGTLTGLPAIELGRGISARPALTTGGGVSGPGESITGNFQPSLDLTQRLGSNINASATVNTDFAETDVDTRRTNLTRFSLFFPEKRSFFLEGADIFSFGLGLGQDVVPYFSRRIGLVGDQQVPLVAGGKVNGRIGRTSFGGVVADTGRKSGAVDVNAVTAVARVKQNLGQQSWVGAILTRGDPLGRPGSWSAGADLTYATSRFRGDKNLFLGAWALATGRSDLAGDTSAAGFNVNYPNDLWEMSFDYKRIGRNFDPSLGFAPRTGVQLLNGNFNKSPRFTRGPVQQLFFEFRPTFAADLQGRWESYRLFIAPVNGRLRSGDRFEFNVHPTGERLVEPFEIASGVTIAPGSYHWRRYRLEGGTAQKRRLYTQFTWWFGGFYGGRLDQFQWTGAWNPAPLVTVEFTGERNLGRLPVGDFTQTLIGNRLRVNVSPNLSLSSYIQYDTNSRSVGVNSRLRWTFTPYGDVFVVYNHNMQSILDRWQLESSQLLIKLQYTLRQ